VPVSRTSSCQAAVSRDPKLRPIRAVSGRGGLKLCEIARSHVRDRGWPRDFPANPHFSSTFSLRRVHFSREITNSAPARAGTSPFVPIARGVPHHVGGERVIGRGAGNSRKHQFLIAVSARCLVRSASASLALERAARRSTPAPRSHKLGYPDEWRFPARDGILWSTLVFTSAPVRRFRRFVSEFQFSDSHSRAMSGGRRTKTCRFLPRASES